MTKVAESGSISQRHGSADPDPSQNVMDPQHWLQWYKSTDPYPYQSVTVSLFYNIYSYSFCSGPSRAEQGKANAGGATQDLHTRGEAQGTFTIRLLLMGEARDIRIEITHNDNPLLFSVAQGIFCLS
jgi:hypothetical protein